MPPPWERGHRSWKGQYWRLQFMHECLHLRPSYYDRRLRSTPTPPLILPLISFCPPPFFPSLLVLIWRPGLSLLSAGYQLLSLFMGGRGGGVMKQRAHKRSAQLFFANATLPSSPHPLTQTPPPLPLPFIPESICLFSYVRGFFFFWLRWRKKKKKIGSIKRAEGREVGKVRVGGQTSGLNF